MVYRGTVKGGVVEFDGGIAPPDGTIVQIEPMPQSSPPANGDTDPLFRMSELAVDTGIDDLATNIDHYLYGAPRASQNDG
jgi:hypothetical protein